MQDLVDLADFMDDDDIAKTMDLALKCIAKPDIPVAIARKAMLQMQSYSLEFKARALKLMAIDQVKAGSGADYRRKSVYMSMAQECHEMAQTLKYLAKDASQL
jgi:hypothetical protein